jgi:hypothetical protein
MAEPVFQRKIPPFEANPAGKDEEIVSALFQEINR